MIPKMSVSYGAINNGHLWGNKNYKLSHLAQHEN